MIQNQYLALLRGINVGGNNAFKMADLIACFEALGFNGVATYIQSGNVIFQSEETDLMKLTTKIEAELANRFNYPSKIVLVTFNQLAAIVKNAPAGFGSKPDEYKYDVIFLKAPLTPTQAIQFVTVRAGVDTALPGEDVLYFSRRADKLGQSYLKKIITMPIYKEMTIRNWNTTRKLLELMEKQAGNR
jgi:uncharacterized protein (DUF1697 family)